MMERTVELLRRKSKKLTNISEATIIKIFVVVVLLATIGACIEACG